MNWLIKLSQKQMPLPVVPSIEDRDKEGLRRIDDRMYQETSDILKHQFPDIGYGGAGQFGVVLKTAPGEMAKVTKDPTEVENATQVYYNYPDWIVTVLEEPKQIQENPDLWLIKMKELKMPPQSEKRLISYLIYPNWKGSTISKEKAISDFTGLIDPQRVSEIYDRLYYIHDQNSSSFWLTDLHGGNFGIDPDDGQLKVLDLGVDFRDSVGDNFRDSGYYEES